MIRFGVAGWDYADWSGTVYPAAVDRRFDRLAHISRFVDVVEINSTFYRPVAARVAASWENDADLAQAVAAAVSGLQPLLDGGKVAALLVQFPQAFHFTERSRTHLERLVELARGWPLAVEVRHASWADQAAPSWFAEHGVAWCVADQPQVGRGSLPLLPRVTSALGYLRLHGRNSGNWFRQGAGRDARYDYLYSPTELEQLADAARQMARSAEELIVVQNNHFRGQALVNALQLKHLVQEVRPRAPQELVEVFPELLTMVAVERSRLF
jgi:uncharacterized protein YecE (DUF72 family)